MNTRISKRSAVAQGFAPFNSSSATHGINFGHALADQVMFAELPWPDAFDGRTGVAPADLPQYTDAAGLPELRTKLALRYGVRHDQVMLTGGASQALQLLADGWIDPGDVVLTEDPSYLQSRALDSHITRLREHYRAKRDGVHRLLQHSRICEPEYSVPSGGFSFWVQLTAGTDPERFIEAASREHDVHLINGRNYGPRSGRHVRLCFSYLPISLIEQGLERLDNLHAKL
ncbi:aminotransferase class I/II-fold pyridoxal phosphate-dependent enzyme [Bradyrhizobium cytisi]|uniref:Aminotransferase class I/II-fold pyridoxal phosphate-dependent enzyme n=1 Tax=Bradyrhizobium cytisi TaxID=515489 RepID=A0A5S4WWD4_9BRAD|nr:aminotransferase class I/II-fold pyridoxal phosphate-dependent enzyme [Bradyrhizobium cytisi]TYL85878.1 aminotransferase class I/II-fold pyridoxal phosphate-dependent enzyme [Bradyrhizobium cytisi]